MFGINNYTECDICLDESDETPNEGTIEHGSSPNGVICQNCYTDLIDAAAEFERDAAADR